jgi:hypothetical protein
MAPDPFAMSLLSILSSTPSEEAREGGDYSTFAVSHLRCVIGNNKALGEHRAWYNGVFSIWAPEQAESPFVKMFAGLNLEHFFDARPRNPDRAVLFEPRSQPMKFTRVSDTTAGLCQEATPYYGIESSTRFELKEPYYIEFSFRCIPRKVLQGGFFGVFWASYIRAFLNKSMYFLADGSSLDRPQWVQLCSQKHDRDSTVRHEADPAEIVFEPGAPILWNQISLLRYSAPFFYGHFKNMVLIYIFRPNPLIRFTHSPSGGGPTEAGDGFNPAWDFQLIVPNYEVGREYGLEGRLVYKPWVDRADVLREVQQWLAEKAGP